MVSDISGVYVLEVNIPRPPVEEEFKLIKGNTDNNNTLICFVIILSSFF